MDCIYELYEGLLWIKETDGEKEYKKPYMTLNEIDEMDIFFWLDLRIYELKKENIENIERYDSSGS